ncbi:glycosyltransferase [Bosea sp. 2RAB26]|uniref:glycosyltransferase n=1 Tax=Bosea sp. 2RAB26 TaxID=3237476 RepID=UPI003F93842B
MRVALIHYWLVAMRGGEKVLESLCRMFPEADIYTHAYDPLSVSETIRKHQVRTSFIGHLPRPTRFYKSYLPLMPLALEQLDLRGYDLIISSESGPAKGIVPPPNALHVCYCHSPMRYVWNMYHDYRERTGFLQRLAMGPLSHYVRNWDAISSMRVDQYVANSENVRSRIQRYYHRDAAVVYPPVNVADFQPVAPDVADDYYLMVGELVSYKRPELAVEAFNRLKRPLVIIGGGELLNQIRRMAGPTVTVMGPQSFDALRYHYARCKALVFPGEEDFGIVPIEAMASGRPVLAYRRGGALETVVEGLSGLFFDEQTVEAIIDGVERMDRFAVDQGAILAHARRFSEPIFRQNMWTALSGWLHPL